MNHQSRFAFSPELIVDLFAGANVGELLAMEQLEKAA